MNVRPQDSVTHLLPAAVIAIYLSELESMSIDDAVGGRDKWREENFLLKYWAILSLRLSLDGFSFDVMIVVEKAVQWLYELVFALPTASTMLTFLVVITLTASVTTSLDTIVWYCELTVEIRVEFKLASHCHSLQVESTALGVVEPTKFNYYARNDPHVQF
jgi:hypothetical protein